MREDILKLPQKNTRTRKAIPWFVEATISTNDVNSYMMSLVYLSFYPQKSMQLQLQIFGFDLVVAHYSKEAIAWLDEHFHFVNKEN